MIDVLRIASVSGGKDSTVLYRKMVKEFGKDGFVAVAADTDWEHKVTINYLKNLHLMAGGPEVIIVKRDFTELLREKGLESTGNGFLDMCLWKGRVPSKGAQFCTEHVKLLPIAAWLEEVRGDREVIMYTGIRAGESENRSKMPPREWSDMYDCYTERPLLTWTEAEVYEYLKSEGIPLNPLYENGSRRVGCWPCIHAAKSELASMPPERWQLMEDFEKRLGRSWFPWGKLPLTFEQKVAINALPRNIEKPDEPDPIAYKKLIAAHPEWMPKVAEVREWARTSRGGLQFDMFAPDAADVPSCMSTWGTCE